MHRVVHSNKGGSRDHRTSNDKPPRRECRTSNDAVPEEVRHQHTSRHEPRCENGGLSRGPCLSIYPLVRVLVVCGSGRRAGTQQSARGEPATMMSKANETPQTEISSERPDAATRQTDPQRTSGHAVVFRRRVSNPLGLKIWRRAYGGRSDELEPIGQASERAQFPAV